MTRVAVHLGFAMLAIHVGGCFNQPFDQSAMLESLGSTVIVAGYTVFSDESARLASSAEAFCKSPTSDRLEDVQDRWRSTRLAWKRMDVASFGPYTEQPWRLGPKIDSWPVREGTLEANLAEPEPITEARLRMLGASSRGLPPLEYLIFDGDGLEASLARFFGANGTQRCAYLTALAQDLSTNANEMIEAWSHEDDGYLAALLASGAPDAPFMSVRDASNEVVNRMLFLTEEIQRIKLGKPLGLESGAEPRPEDVESKYSQHSLQDILANLDGIENFYFGRFGERQGVGVQGWTRWYSPDTDFRVRSAITLARRAVEDVPEPLSRAVVEQPETVQAAYDAVRELRNAIGVDMINALAGSVTFNANDGD